jgi:hypothetical protein
LEASDQNAVVRLSLRAWAPNFESMQTVLGDELSRRLHGDDWREYQAQSVIDTISDPRHHAWVAEREPEICGFTVTAVVDLTAAWAKSRCSPSIPHTSAGVGLALADRATEWLRSQGMRVAMIGTGGDPGARRGATPLRTRGYSLMPMARYFNAL